MSTRPKSHSTFLRDADLPFLEVRDSHISGHPFGLHTHTTYSLSVTLRGATTLVWRGGRRPAPAGTLVFVPPGVVHACNPLPGGTLEYVLFAFAPDWFEARLASAGLHRAGIVLRPAVLDRVPAVREFVELGRALLAGRVRPENKVRLLDAALRPFLNRLGEGVLAGEDSPAVHRAAGLAAAHLARRPASRIALSELARVSGVTPCHLARVFRRVHAMTPHAYQNQLRVELAKTLLARGLPIAQVAVQAGFSDQSHLNRVFRRYAGATPGQYQADAS